MKRLRKPKLKDGQLLVYWGRLPHDEPDVVYEWKGDSSMKRDNALLCYHFGSKRPDPLAKPLYSKMEPSLLEELERRGYDLTTLRFSIMKKPLTTDQRPAQQETEPPDMKAALEISRQVRAEGGAADDALGVKCNLNHMSRTAVIMNYGDPRLWTHNTK